MEALALMGRVAAVLVLISQVILVWIAFDLHGRSAIVFSFVGHPLLLAGVVLGLFAMLRRLRRERLAAARARDGTNSGNETARATAAAAGAGQAPVQR